MSRRRRWHATALPKLFHLQACCLVCFGSYLVCWGATSSSRVSYSHALLFTPRHCIESELLLPIPLGCLDTHKCLPRLVLSWGLVLTLGPDIGVFIGQSLPRLVLSWGLVLTLGPDIGVVIGQSLPRLVLSWGLSGLWKEREHLVVNQMVIIYVHTCMVIFLFIFCSYILLCFNCYTDLDRHTNCTFDATILLSVHSSN